MLQISNIKPKDMNCRVCESHAFYRFVLATKRSLEFQIIRVLLLRQRMGNTTQLVTIDHVRSAFCLCTFSTFFWSLNGMKVIRCLLKKSIWAPSFDKLLVPYFLWCSPKFLNNELEIMFHIEKYGLQIWSVPVEDLMFILNIFWMTKRR